MIKEVIEYFTKNNFITGWQLWPEHKKPELKKNTLPTEDMNNSLTDEHGNYKYKLLASGKVKEVNTAPTESQIAKKELKQFSTLDLFRILVQGIADKNDPEFIQLKEKLNKL